jgi:hypothetical protein
LREWYGFAIGAAFSGVVGVGFYPIMEIVFGVVLAAPWPPYWDTTTFTIKLPLMVVNVFLVEIATYCEMGIDVRSYAEKEKTLFVPL